MRSLRRLGFLAWLPLLLVGCGEEGPSGPQITVRCIRQVTSGDTVITNNITCNPDDHSRDDHSQPAPEGP